MVLLLIKGVSFEQLERFEFWHDSEEKLSFLILEKVDLFHDFAVSTLNNLVSQLLWQIVQQFVLLNEAICRLLIVFQVPLDLLVHNHGQGGALFELGKHR